MNAYIVLCLLVVSISNYKLTYCSHNLLELALNCGKQMKAWRWMLPIFSQYSTCNFLVDTSCLIMVITTKYTWLLVLPQISLISLIMSSLWKKNRRAFILIQNPCGLVYWVFKHYLNWWTHSEAWFSFCSWPPLGLKEKI